jgi:hypothetical protein
VKVVLTGFGPGRRHLHALCWPHGRRRCRRALCWSTALCQTGRHRRRWILGETRAGDALLQALEIGPVADTLALYDAVRRMQVVPFGKSTLIGIAVPTLIPILVLLSTQVPIKEVLKKIVGALL